jgi:hypothetical protein
MSKKKFYKRRWFKITGGIFAFLFLVLIGLDIYYRNLPLPKCTNGVAQTSTIKCPFLAISKPSMESRSAFVDDVEKFGMDRTMATFVAVQVGFQQNGLWSVVKGDAPDIYALEKVHGVTHCDLYSNYLLELEQQAKEKEVDGQITLQDLVEMKKWVAKQTSVEISEPSKIETSLLFVKAGGNLETQKVYTEDVFMLLKGIKPKRDAPINVTLLNKSKALAKW